MLAVKPLIYALILLVIPRQWPQIRGLYNGLLAAGLLWGLWLGEAGFQCKVFFLAYVLVAGLYGTCTVSRKILYVQAIPALIALIALMSH